MKAQRQRQQWDEWDEDEYPLEEQLRDDELFNNIGAMGQASQAQQEKDKVRLLGTIGIALVAVTVTGGFWLLVKLAQAPKQEQAKISQELAEEVQAQKIYANSVQKVDNTVLFAPSTASPGYRQTLWMNLGAKLKSRLQEQLDDPDDLCGRRGQDIASCAAIEEFGLVDKVKYQAINGQTFFLAFKNERGEIVPLRQFTTEEVLDNAEFRKLSLDSAVSTVNLTPSIDPYRIDAARDAVLKARMRRLESENKTDAAAAIAQKAQALRMVEEGTPPKPYFKPEPAKKQILTKPKKQAQAKPKKQQTPSSRTSANK